MWTAGKNLSLGFQEPPWTLLCQKFIFCILSKPVTRFLPGWHFSECFVLFHFLPVWGNSLVLERMCSPYHGSCVGSLARSDSHCGHPLLLFCSCVEQFHKMTKIYSPKSSGWEGPFVLLSVKLIFHPFLLSLLPLKSGSSFTGVCLQFLLLCTWCFLMLQQAKSPLRSHMHWGGGSTCRATQIPSSSGLQRVDWGKSSLRCVGNLPVCLLEPLLWLTEACRGSQHLPNEWESAQDVYSGWC